MKRRHVRHVLAARVYGPRGAARSLKPSTTLQSRIKKLGIAGPPASD